VNLSVPGNAQVVSWPASADGYILQSADSLLPPIKWTNVPVMLETNDGTIDAILPTGGPQGFFRLYHP
jgi:hypothetical protein